jgi:hypothetical protein
MTVLLVLWLVMGQPPQAYEVRFNTATACNAAKAALQREAERINAEPPAQVAGQTILPFPIRVSAICVAAG